MTVIVHTRDGKIERWDGITEIVQYPRMLLKLCRAPGPTKADHKDEEQHYVTFVRLEVI